MPQENIEKIIEKYRKEWETLKGDWLARFKLREPTEEEIFLFNWSAVRLKHYLITTRQSAFDEVENKIKASFLNVECAEQGKQDFCPTCNDRYQFNSGLRQTIKFLKELRDKKI